MDFNSLSNWFRTYETKDGKFMAVGALEPKFHLELFESKLKYIFPSRSQFLVLKIDKGMNKLFEEPEQLVKTLEDIFKSKTQEEWAEIFKGKHIFT